MTYSRRNRLKAEQLIRQEKRHYSIRKVSTIGATSALIGTLAFMSGSVSADETSTVSNTTPATVASDTSTTNSSDETKATTTSALSSEKDSSVAVEQAQTAVESEKTEVVDNPTADQNKGSESPELSAKEAQNEEVEQLATKGTENSQISDDSTKSAAEQLNKEVVHNSASESGLTEQAYQIAEDAGLDISALTESEKSSLNKIRLHDEKNSGTQMTYKQFEDIAQAVIAQNPKYAIPYFNASQIENMPAATAKNAQTGQVEDMDIWDSWPVQDVKTGEVFNWNGYQLVVAMMGKPHENDLHIYLLYNKFGDNNFKNWKNAGSIFGFNENPITQEWSGSATVNNDGTIQLYYTKVDTSEGTNNQRLATATLNLGFDDQNVYINSVTNDKLLTPGGGDGYHYQSYAQWRQGDTGFDNIAMRDPHVIEGEDGYRYLVFEASTGEQNYQGEDQIYNWKNYGGDASYNVKSLFDILSHKDMYDKAVVSNAALGIVRLTKDDKNPEIAEYMTPLLSTLMVSDEVERPNVVKLGDKYYLFTASRLTHGSNKLIVNEVNQAIGDNVVMLGYVSDSLTSGYRPLNGSGVVLTASVPASWRTATYSYYAVPVKGHDDLLLITSYMSNRSEVAGPGKNSTMSPSFLLKVNSDGTTQVLAQMTEQGDWIWDDTSRSQRMVGDVETSRLPGETKEVDWSRIGYYSYSKTTELKPHMPIEFDWDKKTEVSVVPVKETPSNVPTTPKEPSEPQDPKIPQQSETPEIPTNSALSGKTPVAKAAALPTTGAKDNTLVSAMGLAFVTATLAYVAFGGYKRKYN